MKGCSNREKFSLGNESGFRDICDIDERSFRTYLAFLYLVKVSRFFSTVSFPCHNFTQARGGMINISHFISSYSMFYETSHVRVIAALSALLPAFWPLEHVHSTSKI